MTILSLRCLLRERCNYSALSRILPYISYHITERLSMCRLVIFTRVYMQSFVQTGYILPRHPQYVAFKRSIVSDQKFKITCGHNACFYIIIIALLRTPQELALTLNVTPSTLHLRQPLKTSVVRFVLDLFAHFAHFEGE